MTSISDREARTLSEASREPAKHTAEAEPATRCPALEACRFAQLQGPETETTSGWKGRTITVGALFAALAALWALFSAYSALEQAATTKREALVRSHDRDENSHPGIRAAIERQSKRLEKRLDRLSADVASQLKEIQRLLREQK